MNKNIEMLSCFIKIMKNDTEEINKVIPDMYCDNFYNIDEQFLLKNGINNLILDIDGTILPPDDINVPSKLIKKVTLLKRKKINICLMSNNHENRVLPVAKKLNINYLCEAQKPLPIAFDKALNILNSKKSNTAMIGDQMLSDIKGANEYGIYSILVCPISKHQNIQTGTQRILQKKIENHLKKKNIFDKNKFYNDRNMI